MTDQTAQALPAIPVVLPIQYPVFLAGSRFVVEDARWEMGFWVWVPGTEGQDGSKTAGWVASPQLAVALRIMQPPSSFLLPSSCSEALQCATRRVIKVDPNRQNSVLGGSRVDVQVPIAVCQDRVRECQWGVRRGSTGGVT